MSSQLYYTSNFKLATGSMQLAIGSIQLAIFFLFDSIFANWSLQTANFLFSRNIELTR